MTPSPPTQPSASRPTTTEMLTSVSLTSQETQQTSAATDQSAISTSPVIDILPQAMTIGDTDEEQNQQISQYLLDIFRK